MSPGATTDAARIRAQLDHPIIDTDGQVIEYLPWVHALVADIGGADAAASVTAV